MAKKVLIVLADGFEEIEAVTPIDVLRRAGLEVTTAGVGKRKITGAHGIPIEADTEIDRYDGTPDAVVLPGGQPGADNLSKSEGVKRLLARVNGKKNLIGAICASPAVVLAPQGYLDGRKATCYPGFEGRFGSKISFSSDRVVADGNVITSRGPGSAFEFALELVERLVSPAKAAALSEVMLAAAR